MHILPKEISHTVFLLLLLSADFIFVLVGSIHSYTAFGTASFSLGHDFGHAEVYQYIKLFWISGLLFAIFICRHMFIYLCWTILFVFLLLDDALQVHENVGQYLSRELALNPFWGLRSQDLGELIASAIAGAVLLIPLALTHLLSKSPERAVSFRLALLFAILVFFGVGVDMLHSAAGSILKKPLGIVEDGGEMVVVSLMCWFIFGVSYNYYTSRTPEMAEPRRSAAYEAECAIK